MLTAIPYGAAAANHAGSSRVATAVGTESTHRRTTHMTRTGGTRLDQKEPDRDRQDQIGAGGAIQEQAGPDRNRQDQT